MAGTAAVDAAVLLWLDCAGERGRDEGTFERFGGWSDGWGKTCCYCEHVDEFEDKDAGECSSQIGDARDNVLATLWMVYGTVLRWEGG